MLEDTSKDASTEDAAEEDEGYNKEDPGMQCIDRIILASPKERPGFRWMLVVVLLVSAVVVALLAQAVGLDQVTKFVEAAKVYFAVARKEPLSF
eukprot:5220373-Pyramimonas_sp.AAC.1